MVNFAKPQLPAGLLHDMTMTSTTVELDEENGGQFRPQQPTVTTFKGIVMPMSNEDLQYLPEGTYTRNTQKLYTNGARVAVGAQFTDGFDGQTYTVTQELTHGPVHPMKRYAVEKKGVAAAR